LVYEVDFDNPKGIFVSRNDINPEQGKEWFSKNLFRLLFIKNLKTNATKGYYMSIISASQTDFNQVHLKQVGDFTGDINFYSLNGTFLNGRGYKNGKTITFRRIRYDGKTLLMGGGPEKLSQTCSIHGYPVYASYCFELEGSYEACFPKLAGYSYSISCSGSGGGGQYEEIGVEGVDGSPDPYFDCNGDMNGSAYIAGCGCIGGNTGKTSCIALRDIHNKTTDSCISKTVDAALKANKDIAGIMSDIIKKFDASKSVVINIYDGHIYYTDGNGNITGVPKPGQTIPHGFTNGVFNADITLSLDYFSGSSKESVIATLIHEVVHSYLAYTGNNTLNTAQHSIISEKYIDPMAAYLQSYFNMNMKEAYALAWSGIPDSKAFKDAKATDSFAMSNGNTITKDEIGNISAQYNGGVNGTKICN